MKQKRHTAKTAKEERESVIENRQKAVRVGVRALLEFSRHLREELGLGEESVAVRFVTDAEMARLNETYRDKTGTTDVLSFPAESRKRPSSLRTRLQRIQGRQLGDIAISPVVAQRNAKLYRRRLPEELQVLILHGVLHLLGYDHEKDHGEMSRVEMRLRRRLGIA